MYHSYNKRVESHEVSYFLLSLPGMCRETRVSELPGSFRPAVRRMAMSQETLSGALEREHREIDTGVEEFIEDASDPAPLVRAMQALRRHIYLEEAFLFPPLREQGLSMPIFVMEREHGELWDTMDELEEFLEHVAGPTATAGLSRHLLEQLDRHNSKEEPVIYPHADGAVPAETADELRAFLRSGRLPDGWVCAHAAGTAVGPFGA